MILKTKLDSTKLKMVYHPAVLIIILLATILFNISCSEQEAADGEFSMPPMPVEVAAVTEQKMSDKFNAVGTIEAIEEVTIVSEIDATVTGILFEEGSYVKRGQVLVQLDDSQLKAELIRSEALFTQSQATYNRIKQIVDQKAGTPQDLDDALANLKVAEADFKLAEVRFNKTRIVAPFSGQIGSKKVSVGTFLRTGDAITELANLNEIRVSFTAPERHLDQLKRGAEATVTTTVYPGYEVKGKIIAIDPVLDSETRTAEIIARVKNPGQKFRSGMSADISVILSERANALTIPNQAVFAAGDQTFVFVVNPDSSVMQVPVTLGLLLSDVVEVVNGLEMGMQVVQAGHQKLFNGAKVMPININQMSSTQKSE